MYVVGGAVRDQLLGREPRELDLVVEGDAVAVARRAAERVGGALTVHERFGTATVLADGFAFDLAGARRESYAQPGALPDVQLGATIEEDLARRDFTVNAIARRLADDEIVAFPGARDGPGGGRPARPARPLVHRRPDADAAARPVRAPARVRGRSRDRRAGRSVAVRDRVRRPARQRAAPADPRGRDGRAGALRARPRTAGRRFRRRPGCSRSSMFRSTASASPRVNATWSPRTEAPARRLGTDAELWRAFRRERPETIELLRGGGSATVARCRPAPQARDRRPRPARRRALRPRGRRGAGAGHGRDARGPRPGPRVAATRGYGGGRRRGSRRAGWRSR